MTYEDMVLDVLAMHKLDNAKELNKALKGQEVEIFAPKEIQIEEVEAVKKKVDQLQQALKETDIKALDDALDKMLEENWSRSA